MQQVWGLCREAAACTALLSVRIRCKNSLQVIIIFPMRNLSHSQQCLLSIFVVKNFSFLTDTVRIMVEKC